jgi:hypothetical protein
MGHETRGEGWKRLATRYPGFGFPANVRADLQAVSADFHSSR